MNWLYFILVYFTQLVLTIPEFRATCRQPLPWLLYFGHHTLDVFVFWGPVFLRSPADYAIHAVITLIVGLHWFYNDNRCIATEMMNARCGYERGRWLDSLKNRLGLRSWSEGFHFIWLGILLGYDAWVLWRGHV